MPLKKGTEMNRDQIYALYYDYADERHYFYVGRTNDPKRRLSEHRANVKNKTHTEDVYQYIRDYRQPNGIDLWDMEILTGAEPNHSPEDEEDYWVVLLLRDGQDLKNMKHGDLRRIRNEVLCRHGGEFKEISDFIEFRKRVEYEVYERSERLKKDVLGYTPMDPALLAAIQLNTDRFRKANEIVRLREEKKLARARANAREKEQFLKSVRDRIIGDNE
jgi:hypothetical protein